MQERIQEGEGGEGAVEEERRRDEDEEAERERKNEKVEDEKGQGPRFLFFRFCVVFSQVPRTSSLQAAASLAFFHPGLPLNSSVAPTVEKDVLQQRMVATGNVERPWVGRGPCKHWL